MENASTTEPRSTSGDENAQALIAVRAYELWLQRGGGHGSDVEDWLQAEREMLAALTKTQPQP